MLDVTVVLMTMFEHLGEFPVGVMKLDVASPQEVATAGSHMITQALQLAAPAVVTTLILNIALAFITRVVPTANLFGIGMGAMILCGLLAISSQSDAVVLRIYVLALRLCKKRSLCIRANNMVVTTTTTT